MVSSSSSSSAGIAYDDASEAYGSGQSGIPYLPSHSPRHPSNAPSMASPSLEDIEASVDGMKERLFAALSPTHTAYDRRGHLLRCAGALTELATDSHTRPFLPLPIVSLLEAVADEIRVAADSSARGDRAQDVAPAVAARGSVVAPFHPTSALPSRDDQTLGSTAVSLALSSTFGSSIGGLTMTMGTMGTMGTSSSGILRGPTPVGHATERPVLTMENVDMASTGSTIATLPLPLPLPRASSGHTDGNHHHHHHHQHQHHNAGVAGATGLSLDSGGTADDDEDDGYDGFAEFASDGGHAGGEMEGVKLDIVPVAPPGGHVEGDDDAPRRISSPAGIPRLSLKGGAASGTGDGVEGGEGGQGGEAGGHGRHASFHEEFMAMSGEMSETWRAEAGLMPTVAHGV
jgi:hypothetical protein